MRQRRGQFVQFRQPRGKEGSTNALVAAQILADAPCCSQTSLAHCFSMAPVRVAAAPHLFCRPCCCVCQCTDELRAEAKPGVCIRRCESKVKNKSDSNVASQPVQLNTGRMR